MLCGRLVLTRLVQPTTSNAVLHTSAKIFSLPKASPLDEELASEQPTQQKAFRKAREQVIELEPKKRRNKRPEIDLVVTDIHLSQWTKMEAKSLIKDYLQLSKSKLTMLITSTAMAGFMMAPVAGISPVPLLACTAGTALLSSAANACNQLLEAPYDAQMKRTQGRVLVVHRFSPLHAFTFAGVTGFSGIAILGYFANPLAAALGALNWFLYAGVYTPMKRTHIGCTWAGAVVGAIPPMMGYAAAAGHLDLAAGCLAMILYSWQFPHFNGLSWNLRGDYSRAGYRVMCVTNEHLCRVTSIRHSFALVGLCSVVAPLTDLTTMTFALDSLPVNAYLCYLSYKFYKVPDSKNSRKLFFYSLAYLPLLMLLMVMSNYGRSPEQKKPVEERVRLAVEKVKQFVA